MNKPSALSVRDTISFEANVEQEKQALEQRRKRRGIDMSGMLSKAPIEREPDAASALLMQQDAKSLGETTLHDTEVFDGIVRTFTEESTPNVTAEDILRQAHALFQEQCGRPPILAETTERDTILFGTMFHELLSQSTPAVTVEENRRIAMQNFHEVFGRPPMLREIPETHQG
ncbi:hypothetical protein EXS65_00480 [Candidatus Peribacteria bacterium]|nr:hypothetical protein [Candidatus Peribacteria bacterium]